MAIGDRAYEFLKQLKADNKLTVNDRGVWKVKQHDYLEFMNSCGITEKMVKDRAAADNELITGMYRLNTERLEELVTKTLEEDPNSDCKQLKATTSVVIPYGKLELTNTSAIDCAPGPNRAGEAKITKYNTVRMHYTQLRAIDSQTIKDHEQRIRDLIMGKADQAKSA